jgi:N-acetyl-anhydromuramyl-L-alanine amidase AmpD
VAAGEYPGSTFDGAYSGNYSVASRPSSNPINKIIVHTVQGRWWSARDWFKDSRAGVSAHYIVHSFDSDVNQPVREKDIAYHAGNWSYNQTSIGIEHEGYVENPSYWYTETMYRSSARLSAYLCKKYNIPIDRSHIIGHNEVPDPYNPGQYGGAGGHTDPGSGWDWAKYMAYVREAAGVATAAPYSQIVDNATAGRFSAGSNWKTSSYGATGNYGATHRYAKAGATFAPARFKIKVPARGSYDVYGWWPAASGYNNRAQFRIYTAGGWVAKVVDQRRSGGRWVLLGRHTLNAGDAYWVQVSNRSADKQGLIVADAVRIVRR